MKKKSLVLLIVSTLAVQFLVYTFAIAADERTIEEALKEVMVRNLKALEKEGIDAAMNTIHSQSPAFLQTKQATQILCENYDLKYSLLFFKYIGQDDDYAVARVKQAAEKISGGAFNNNELDSVQVFRKENGEWKIWTAAVLEIKYISSPAPK